MAKNTKGNLPMRFRELFAGVVAVAVFACPRVVQSRWDGDWSVLGTETVAPSGTLLSARGGWPESSIEITRGVNRWFDIGARLSLLYGLEGRTDFASQVGYGLAFPLRFSLARTSRVLLLVHVDPGVRYYTYEPAWTGLQAPFGINFEAPIDGHIKVGLAADMMATLFVTGRFSPQLFFGPMVGPWLEWRVAESMSIGIDSRLGFIGDAYSTYGDQAGGYDSHFGYRLQFVIGLCL